MINTRDLTINAGGTVEDSQAGQILLVEALSAGAVDITFLDPGGQRRGTVTGATVGRKYRPGFQFSGYEVRGAAGETVRVLVGDADADAELSSITATITNVSLATVEKLGLVLTPVAPVVAGPAAVVLLAANIARRVFYARNTGPDAVALIAAGQTFAQAAVVINPGETWVEDKSPGAAWSCITDAGNAATITLVTGA